MLPEQEARAADSIAVVLSNWRSELATLGRSALQKLCQESPLVEFGPENVRVIEFHEQRSETHIPVDGTGEAVIARRLAQHFQGQRRSISLSVPERLVLRPHVTMPHASNKSLQEALRFEVERLSPIDPKDVFFDFVRVPTAAEAGLSEFELRIVRKQDIATSIDICRSAGLDVTAIKLGNDSTNANRANFAIDRLTFWRSELRRLLVPVLLLAACVLVVMVVVGIYWRSAVAQHRLTDAAVEAGIRAARVEQLQRRIRETASDLGLPTKMKRSSPLFIQAVAELSRILPDNTWVTQLALDSSKIRIQGVSGSASELLGLIDRSPIFSNAQFVAPVVHEQNTNGDHFDIAFDVRSPNP